MIIHTPSHLEGHWDTGRISEREVNRIKNLTALYFAADVPVELVISEVC